MRTLSLVMTAALTLTAAGPLAAMQIGERRGDVGRRDDAGRATGVVVAGEISYESGYGDRDRDRDRCRDWDRRYDDRWDRRGGGHGWDEPYRGRRDRDCDDWRYRSDWRRTGITVRVVFEREYDRLQLRLARMHADWHRHHGWHGRSPGWHRAHRALHERLEREYAKFWRR